MNHAEQLFIVKRSLHTKLISGFNVLEALIFCIQDMEEIRLDIAELVEVARECCGLSRTEATEYVVMAEREYKCSF